MKKRIAVIALCVVLGALVLTGCGKADVKGDWVVTSGGGVEVQDAIDLLNGTSTSTSGSGADDMTMVITLNEDQTVTFTMGDIEASDKNTKWEATDKGFTITTTEKTKQYLNAETVEFTVDGEKATSDVAGTEYVLEKVKAE